MSEFNAINNRLLWLVSGLAVVGSGGSASLLATSATERIQLEARLSSAEGQLDSLKELLDAKTQDPYTGSLAAKDLALRDHKIDANAEAIKRRLTTAESHIGVIGDRVRSLELAK